ncbi:MAG: YaeQ family protein [Burkholderiales bacterium]|nr:MAG: YaeQ family protein [Burkholderiales bacterium]
MALPNSVIVVAAVAKSRSHALWACGCVTAANGAGPMGRLQPADGPRRAHAKRTVTLARQPSENDRRMMACLLTHALRAPANDSAGSFARVLRPGRCQRTGGPAARSGWRLRRDRRLRTIVPTATGAGRCLDLTNR